MSNAAGRPAETSTTTASTARKPADEEIDVHGLPHRGKVRKVNQDNFLLASLRKRMEVHLTSLPEINQLKLEDDRLAFLAMIADGVGGSEKGEVASRIALEQITQYVIQSARSYYGADAHDASFIDVLEAGAPQTHPPGRPRGATDPGPKGRATTLAAFIRVGPWADASPVGAP